MKTQSKLGLEARNTRSEKLLVYEKRVPGTVDNIKMTVRYSEPFFCQDHFHDKITEFEHNIYH